MHLECVKFIFKIYLKNNKIIMKPIMMGNYKEISDLYTELSMNYTKKNIGFFQN